MDNKISPVKNRMILYKIAQCIIMINCFLCFLEIYESHLLPLSYGLIAVAVVLFFISGSYRNFKFSTVSTSFIVLFGYLLLGDLINLNITTFTSQMCLSGLALFFCFSFFNSDNKEIGKSIKYLFIVSIIMSSIISFLSIISGNIDNSNAIIGIVTNKNSLAAYTSVGIISSLYLINYKKLLSLNNFLLLILLIINIYTLFRTKSRTPIMVLTVFSIIMGFYFLCILLSKKKNSKIMHIIFIIFCIILITGCFVFIINRNSFALASDTVRDFFNTLSSSRIGIWETCIELTKESPIFGVKDSRYDELMLERMNVLNSPHNVYFSLMTINGVPALLIYLFIIGYSVVSAIRLIIKFDNNEDKKRMFFYLAILVGYLVGDFFECFSIRSYMPSAYIVILMFAAIEAERLSYGKKVQGIGSNTVL